MNPHASSPYMLILKADPDRYINRTAPAILALIKLAEGCAAFMWCFRMLDCILRILTGKTVQTPAGVLFSLLPWEIVRLAKSGAVLPGGTLGNVLGCIAAACLLIELLCLTAEAAAAVMLRFAMPAAGAKCFRLTRRLTLAACVLLTVCVVISLVQQAFSVFQSGLNVALAALYPMIVQLVLVLLLALRIEYHRGASVVMDAVDYEFRLGFKETGMPEHRLGLCSFLFGVLFLVAAGALVRLSLGRYAAISAVFCVKFFAVWKSWQFFRQCHR